LFDGGNAISIRASVGQEPMHERQPTQRDSTTTTGLLFLFSGVNDNGNKASNGQWLMQRSQPVQSACVIATILCVIKLLQQYYTLKSLRMKFWSKITFDTGIIAAPLMVGWRADRLRMDYDRT
jgi:hypothetical protein